MISTEPTVAAAVREKTGASWSRARNLCSEGRVTVDGKRCLDPATRISPDAVVEVNEHGPKLEKGPLAKEAIVFWDRDLVIVDKPAGMLTVADEEGNKDTLAEYTRLVLRRLDRTGSSSGLGVVHRLDKDTSGLMVFTRTADAKRMLATQFHEHTIDRVYWA
ncbi:MAG: pseudouridine synthase, partial [Thermoanaerobaculia bacterium]